MAEQRIEVLLEIPSNITKQEVWAMEEQLKQVEGVSVDLHEPKDAFSIATQVLQLTVSISGSIALISGDIKSIYEVSKILYDFLHNRKNKEKNLEDKKKIIITTNRKKVEIYNLSIEEIEKLLKDK